MSVSVVTITNRRPREPYYCFDQFFASLKRFGHEATILGWQQRWGGLMTKPQRLLEWLKDGNAPEKLIVADSWDLVFAKSPDYIYDTFLATGADLVLNAEKNCFPLGHLADKFPECGTEFRYLNSGFIVGHRDAFVTMLEHMYKVNVPEGFNCDDHVDSEGRVVHPNDQGYITLAYLDQPVKMILDHECHMAQTMCGCKMDEFDFTSGEYVQNKVTGSFPAAFHFNGGSKTDGLLSTVLSTLGL